jgi:hypothetical protein
MRACSLDIAAHLKNIGAALLVFASIYYDMPLFFG